MGEQSSRRSLAHSFLAVKDMVDSRPGPLDETCLPAVEVDHEEVSCLWQPAPPGNFLQLLHSNVGDLKVFLFNLFSVVPHMTVLSRTVDQDSACAP